MIRMSALRPSRRFILFLWMFLVAEPALAQVAKSPDEIPIEKCDRLPVVAVQIDGARMRFLLDTGATSILNIKSFAKGRSKSIRISSWSGTAATSAREVSLPELELGRFRLTDLKLPAIDLSPIGEACGGRIDGIFGVDLMEKMGLTIDLERRIARLSGTSATTLNEAEAKRHAEAQQNCLDAFNKADVAQLEMCFDPEVVLFTPWGEYRGRKVMLEYLQNRYFKLKPLPRMEMRIKSMHILGPAAWYDYDYSIELPSGRIDGRGTGVCRKSGERWLLLNMHNSKIEPEPPGIK
jgi:hypothetical protein